MEEHDPDINFSCQEKCSTNEKHEKQFNIYYLILFIPLE